MSFAFGAFVKLRKATISFVMSVRPHGKYRLPLDGFSLNFVSEDFSKTCHDSSNLIKIGQK